jgi:hypothetical protein
MHFTDVFFFSIGYCLLRGVLHFVPIITIFPYLNLTYRDDNGVCYIYERETVECGAGAPEAT